MGDVMQKKSLSDQKYELGNELKEEMFKFSKELESFISELPEELKERMGELQKAFSNIDTKYWHYRNHRGID